MNIVFISKYMPKSDVYYHCVILSESHMKKHTTINCKLCAAVKKYITASSYAQGLGSQAGFSQYPEGLLLLHSLVLPPSWYLYLHCHVWLDGGSSRSSTMRHQPRSGWIGVLPMITCNDFHQFKLKWWDGSQRNHGVFVPLFSRTRIVRFWNFLLVSSCWTFNFPLLCWNFNVEKWWRFPFF